MFFMYFNSNQKNFSFQAKTGPDKGRVVYRLFDADLENVYFKVSEAGRQRAIKEGHKNVHAGLLGHYRPQGKLEQVDVAKLRPIYYNPFKTSTFVVDNNPVGFSPKVYLRNGVAYVPSTTSANSNLSLWQPNQKIYR